MYVLGTLSHLPGEQWEHDLTNLGLRGVNSAGTWLSDRELEFWSKKWKHHGDDGDGDGEREKEFTHSKHIY